MILRFVLLLALLAPPALAADTVLRNGTIYTLDGDRPSAVSALAIEDGVVVAVGEDAARLEAEQIIDLDGAWVIPGLVDAHAHLYNLGTVLGRVDLRDTKSAASSMLSTETFSTVSVFQCQFGRRPLMSNAMTLMAR